MTPDEFKALVSSKRSADRRLAGRAVAANPRLVDRQIIEGAFHRETVPQIRQQFGSALEALEVQTAPSQEPPAKQAREIYDQAYVAAVRAVTETVLHQLNPLIGDVEQAASSEISNFDESTTRARIAQTKLQLDAIAKLYNASKAAKIEEFDVASLVRNCLPSDLDHRRCAISFAGPTPQIIQGDPSLVSAAVTNGLRNAVEASLPVAEDQRRPAIIVNWGATDKDYWISILDEGVGFHGNIQGAFEIGATTKPGHLGHGLPMVKAAMLSLSGNVELTPQKDAGCALNLSWPVLKVQK